MVSTSGQRITYWLYDLMTTTLLGTLPFTDISFSQKLNGAGTFAAALDLADPRVQKKTWLGATQPARTLIIIDVGGAIVWGGILWDRPYASSTRMLSVKGAEAWSYIARRMQARDYTTPPATGPGHVYWPSNPARADHIAAALLADALARAGSAFSTMALVFYDTATDPNVITESYPLTQLQTLGSMITMIATCGYGTGFDFGISWAWSGTPGSTPVPTLSLSYPRAGRIAGTTGLVIDAGQVGAGGYTWPEAGSQQANRVAGTSSGTGTLYATAATSGVIAAGWPLLEEVKNYIAIDAQNALQGAVNDSLAIDAWPVVNPTFTVPMFGSISAGDFTMGDTTRVIIPPDERFADGLDTYLRISQVAYKGLDEGIPLMTFTLIPPPTLPPVPPPPGL